MLRSDLMKHSKTMLSARLNGINRRKLASRRNLMGHMHIRLEWWRSTGTRLQWWTSLLREVHVGTTAPTPKHQTRAIEFRILQYPEISELSHLHFLCLHTLDE